MTKLKFSPLFWKTAGLVDENELFLDNSLQPNSAYKQTFRI